MLGVALTALLGRALAPDALGFFTLVATVYLTIQAALDLGSGVLAVREIARDPARERRLLEGLMGLRQAAGVLLAVALVAFAAGEHDARRRAVLLGVAFSLLALAPSALPPAFQVRQAQGRLAFVGALSQIVVVAGVLLFSLRGVGGIEYAWLLVLRELLSPALLWFFAHRLLGFAPRPRLRGTRLREFLAPAAVFGGAVLAHDLYLYLSVFLVRVLKGEAELGAYAAALRPLNPLLAMPALLVVPLLPIFSASALGDRARYAAQVTRAAALMFGVGAVGAVAGFGLATDVIQLLYGGRYLEGLEAPAAFRWLCLALAVAFLTAPFSAALLAAGRERLLLRMAALGLLLSTVLGVLLIPSGGAAGAAASFAFSETLFGAGVIGAFLGRSGLPRFEPLLLLPVPAALLTAAVSLAWPGTALARVTAGSLVAGGCLLALLSAPGARSFRRELEAAASTAGGKPE